MKTNEWDEAARQAAFDINLEVCSGCDDAPLFNRIITRNFADLKATHEKLVGIVDRQRKYIEVLNRCDIIRSADELVNMKLLNDLLVDPLVVAAIERSR